MFTEATKPTVNVTLKRNFREGHYYADIKLTIPCPDSYIPEMLQSTTVLMGEILYSNWGSSKGNGRYRSIQLKDECLDKLRVDISLTVELIESRLKSVALA